MPTEAAPTPSFKKSIGIMTGVFSDDFERSSAAKPMPPPAPAEALAGDAAPQGDSAKGNGTKSDPSSPALSASADQPEPDAPDLGPNWYQAGTKVWRIEGGRLCGQRAHNHGVWLKKVLPVNARIEFDATSYSTEGDLKTEIWGDGKSAATGSSYTNATSYLAIFGGWKNTVHAIARLNEHGNDRKEVPLDKDSPDPRTQPVALGQTYHFKIERSDGKTVRFFIDDQQILSFPDKAPLAGAGHDHFGFNNWEAKVCFDNLKITPLP